MLAFAVLFGGIIFFCVPKQQCFIDTIHGGQIALPLFFIGQNDTIDLFCSLLFEPRLQRSVCALAHPHFILEFLCCKFLKKLLYYLNSDKSN